MIIIIKINVIRVIIIIVIKIIIITNIDRLIMFQLPSSTATMVELIINILEIDLILPNKCYVKRQTRQSKDYRAALRKKQERTACFLKKHDNFDLFFKINFDN